MTGLLFVVIGCAVALLALVVYLQPDHFVVRREAVIDASPRKVFAAINNLHEWESWSPWAKLDPNAEIRYEGPASGPGATFEWSGDKNVGAGRMTIVDSRPGERVDLKLDMRKPIAAIHDVSFVLAPEGEAATEGHWLARALGFGGGSGARKTHVVWSMSGKAGLASKAMCLVLNRDKMVGQRFEQGLENLGARLSK
ncbi:MAG: SRPBCC family protein [Methylocystis sp.]|uniref:SRPBCC family protein n=1 Tax=Methylocystis sp. TaxID=1911079 RepID=UPI003D0D3513